MFYMNCKYFSCCEDNDQLLNMTMQLNLILNYFDKEPMISQESICSWIHTILEIHWKKKRLKSIVWQKNLSARRTISIWTHSLLSKGLEFYIKACTNARISETKSLLLILHGCLEHLQKKWLERIFSNWFACGFHIRLWGKGHSKKGWPQVQN